MNKEILEYTCLILKIQKYIKPREGMLENDKIKNRIKIE